MYYHFCRGILQSGLYTANLWKGPMPNSRVERYSTAHDFDLNPCAPCINNPDPQSVKITIQFPRYTYPVFFPSSEPETCSFLLEYVKPTTINTCTCSIKYIYSGTSNNGTSKTSLNNIIMSRIVFVLWANDLSFYRKLVCSKNNKKSFDIQRFHCILLVYYTQHCDFHLFL